MHMQRVLVLLFSLSLVLLFLRFGYEFIMIIIEFPVHDYQYIAQLKFRGNIIGWCKSFPICLIDLELLPT